MTEALAGYPLVVSVPVQWGEMDAYGIVNSTVYLRYFSAARAAYLEKCGFLETYHHNKIGAILRSTNCRYHQALRYPDTVLVGARVISVERDRFTMEHCAVSQKANAVAADGSTVIVSFDYDAWEKTALPDDVRRRITEIEQR